MNDLLSAMAQDMRINKYRDESDQSFAYRVCYSALGMWSLSLARSSFEDHEGISKHGMTIYLEKLIAQYEDLFPGLDIRFAEDRPLRYLPKLIRRLYEETGYLMLNDSNCLELTKRGRTVSIGNSVLFFGSTNSENEVNGLGIYTNRHQHKSSIKEILIRDSLTPEEYFQACYNSCDFEEKDIDYKSMQFFNPKATATPYHSWYSQMQTECTIARLSEYGQYFRVMRSKDTVLFSPEPPDSFDDTLVSYEYRRLYFALKQHYGTPLKAWITAIDDQYSLIQIAGHLPNREYYLMLLTSWPQRNAFDKSNFIIKNSLCEGVINALQHIGIEMKEGTRFG